MNKLLLSPRGFYSFIAMIVVLTLTTLACGAGSSVPNSEQPAAALPTQSLAQSTIVPPASTPIPAMPEQRRLTLEFPPKIRVGDSDIVRLTLEVDALGNVTPTAQIDGNVVQGNVIEIPNLYETHHVVVESRFDVSGLQVSPPELISQTLEQGQSVTFYWSVRPTEPGNYQGTIWLYLRFIDKASGEESRKVVSAQILKIEAVDFFGLSANFARGTGVVGSVIGAVVGFPFFEDIVKFIFGRKKKT